MQEGRKSALRCLPSYDVAKAWAIEKEHIKKTVR